MSLKHILGLIFLALLAFTGCEEWPYTDGGEPPSLAETDASWSPDGSTIAYCRRPLGKNDTAGIWLVDSDGTNDRYLCDGFQADWSPDGKRLVVATLSWCIYLIDKDGSNFEWLIRDGASNSPTWSPDGKWVAFTRPYGTSAIINVETQEQRTIPGGGGFGWSPDSKELTYMYLPGSCYIKIVSLQDMIVRNVLVIDDDKYGPMSPPPPLVTGWKKDTVPDET